MKHPFSKKERGQVLVIVALSLVGIIAIIGLAVDAGVMFLDDARLRRAVDSAALAAALQYRSGTNLQAQLVSAATEYVVLNGVTLDSSDPNPVKVHTCTDQPVMCYDPVHKIYTPRKLVSVEVSATVHLAFLPVIGINTIKISAIATGESASLDLVLVLDTSESMTNKGGAGLSSDLVRAMRDPTVCNDDAKVVALGVALTSSIPGECQPFQQVKQAAEGFINSGFLYFPYDRVSVVTFDKTATTWLQFNEDCNTSLYPADCASSNPATLQHAITETISKTIENLQVFDANGYDTNGHLVANNFCPNGQPCRPYCEPDKFGYCDEVPVDRINWKDPSTDPAAQYLGKFECGNGYNIGDDPSQCTTTNMASGLYSAGTAFCGSANGASLDPKCPYERPSALWVVVLLTDGSADAGTYNDVDNTPACPGGPDVTENTWDRFRAPFSSNPLDVMAVPLCRDVSSETRHCANSSTLVSCEENGNGLDAPLFQHGHFDPINYDADDAAHDAADYVGQTQSAVIFSIGMGGNQVHSSDDAGGKFLNYAAKISNGAYFDASTADLLPKVFKQIGQQIATRLAH